MVPPCSSPQTMSTPTPPNLAILMPSSQEVFPVSASSTIPPLPPILSVVPASCTSQASKSIPFAPADDLKPSPPKVTSLYVPTTSSQASNAVDLNPLPLKTLPESSPPVSGFAAVAPTFPHDLASTQPTATLPLEAAAPATYSPSLNADDLICSPTKMPLESSTSVSAIAVAASTLPPDLAAIQPTAYSPQPT
jgi:hypothetical protein